jgi:hypothetical protein
VFSTLVDALRNGPSPHVTAELALARVGVVSRRFVSRACRNRVAGRRMLS